MVTGQEGKGWLVKLRLTLVSRLREFLDLLWTKVPGTVWELVWVLVELDLECDRTWSSLNSDLTSWLWGSVEGCGQLRAAHVAVKE